MRRRIRVRSIGIAAAVAVAGLVLSGCAAGAPGAAALVGDTQISDEEIADQMRSLNEAAGLPESSASPEVLRALVTGAVTSELVDITAQELDVSVSADEVDKEIQQTIKQFENEEEFVSAAVQNAVPPEQIQELFRDRLLVAKISEALEPGSEVEKQQAAGVAMLQQTSESVGVDVAPKYGVWSARQLAIVPPEDPVSLPAAPLPGQLPELLPAQ